MSNEDVSLLNFKVNNEIRLQMNIQAAKQKSSISKVWEDAALLYLKSLGVSVNLEDLVPLKRRGRKKEAA